MKLIHRPNFLFLFSAAHIWISLFLDLLPWSENGILIRASKGALYGANEVGFSSTPLLFPNGWIIFYHGIKRKARKAIYRFGMALLLNTDNIAKVIRRNNEWIYNPCENGEREDDVNDFVFPRGCAIESDEVRLYYGAAFTSIVLAIADLNELREYILSCPFVSEKSKNCGWLGLF